MWLFIIAGFAWSFIFINESYHPRENEYTLRNVLAFAVGLSGLTFLTVYSSVLLWF